MNASDAGELCESNDYFFSIISAITDGAWAGWQGWSKCTSQCGNGLRTRIRDCDNPAPRYGGKDCEGVSGEVELCYEHLCVDGQYEQHQSHKSTLC